MREGLALSAEHPGDSSQPQPNSETRLSESTVWQDEETTRAEFLVVQEKDDFLEKSPHELSRLESILEDFSELDRASLKADDGDAPTSVTPLSSSPRFVQTVAPLHSDSADATHSFLRKPESVSVWHRKWARAVMSVGGLLLLCGLLIQVVLHQRDRIATHEPAAKPVLETLCQLLDCRIEPLRDIESIVIDNSSFAKVRGDVYRLNVTLRNAAPLEVAMPGLELTLTDMQDQLMARRIFLAPDFGFTSESMSAGAELSLTVPVSIKGTGGVERVSGYRLIAFYP